jgi:hypothetical protein
MHRDTHSSAACRCVAVLMLVWMSIVLAPAGALAAVKGESDAPSVTKAAGAETTGSSLESAAAKASSTGRAVAMSLIGLALAVAAVVLVFRRDFKEAASLFAVGLIAVLLATPTGVSLLRDTVGSLFGAP